MDCWRLSVTLRDYAHEFMGVSGLTYSELSREIEQLSYRDKFRLAQLLIQLARKEEEEQNPEQRQKRGPSARLDPELVQFVADRLRKLKPSKKGALQLNRWHVSVSRRHFRRRQRESVV